MNAVAIPHYDAILLDRAERLARMRSTPGAFAAMCTHYRECPADFVEDWLSIQEPRHAAIGLPTTVPFQLWPRQRELINWMMERYRLGENACVVKARDVGCTWLSLALAVTICLFTPGAVVGVASRKVEYVDGTPKSLLEKVRFLMRGIPPDFLGGWNRDKHTSFMKVIFPGTGSVITGEGGIQVGRGDRTSLHLCDEVAFMEDQDAIDAALSQTTRCRIDISTPHGMGNSFATKVYSGKVPVFRFSWRDHPGRDDAWLQKQITTLPAHVVAQEILCDFTGSVEGLLIPRIWIEAAVDAHKRLGIEVTGQKFAGFDIADTGDRSAITLRRGILVEHLESWHGAGSNLYESALRAMNICDRFGWDSFLFDSDGMGTSINGDAEQINRERGTVDKPKIRADSWRGSERPFDPRGEMIPGYRNEDRFLNSKSQGWWNLRMKFQATHRAVVLGIRPFDPDTLISLPADLPELHELMNELSQPIFAENATGKLVVDKKGGGTGRSPDRADSLMISFSPASSGSTFALLSKLGAMD